MAAQEVQLGATLGIGSVSLTVGECSITSTEQSAYDTLNSKLNINVLADSIASNCLGVSVTSSSQWGYTMTLAGSNPTLGNQVIGSTDGTIESPTLLTRGLTNSVWGFAIPSSQVSTVTNGFDTSYDILGPTNKTNTSLYAQVPSTATPISQTNTLNTTPNSYDIFFAVASGAYVPTGTYTGTVTISVMGNAAPVPAFMQELTASSCPMDRTMAIDARNNNTYWVRLIPGTGAGGTDLCWMETNLAYRGGGNNQYGDATPTLTAGTTAPGVLNPATTGTNQACRGDNTTMDTFGQGCFWEPTGSGITTGTTNPSTSTTGTGQYGLLYNWCAAMGNQPAACQTTAATPADPAINICPLGWRLPTVEPTTGEFTLLNNEINGGLANTDAGLRTNSLFMRGGRFSSGGFLEVGTVGRYWSSTVSSTANAHLLYLAAALVSPAGSFNKGQGFAIRCVAD